LAKEGREEILMRGFEGYLADRMYRELSIMFIQKLAPKVRARITEMADTVPVGSTTLP